MKPIARATTIKVVLIALAALSAGCKVGPDYKQPDAKVPDAFSEATTQPATQPTAASLTEWWRMFNDAQLNQLIDSSLQSNLDLRAATARLREARALRRVSKAGLWPEIDATGSYSRNRASENSFRSGGGAGAPGFIAPGSEQDLYQAGFDAAWEIDLFGGTRRGIEASTAEVQAAVEDLRDVQVSLMAEVARNYIELRGSQQRLAIANRNIQSQQDAVEITEARSKAGLINELDVAQAKSLLASTKAQLPSLESAAKQSMHRLAVLLGREPGALVAELSPEGHIPPAGLGRGEVPVGLPSELLRRRPDVRRSERQLAAATARIGVATADLFPSLSLTGTAGLESISTSDFFTGGSRYWSIGPTVRWPIFAGGRIRANIEVQNALEEQAKIAYEQTVLGSLEETENALVAFAKERERYERLVDAVEANRHSVALSAELYRRGLTGFINVVTAQTALYRSEDELSQSQRSVSTNLVAIYKALGGGWNLPAAPSSHEVAKQN